MSNHHIDGSEIDPSYWVRFGPDVVPLPKLQAAQTATVFNQQLNPTMYMTIDSQGITNALIQMRNPVGCEVPTGTNFPIAIPLLTSQMNDIFGLPIPGGPQAGSQFVVSYTSDGNPVAAYGLSSSSTTSKKLPFVSDFYVGEALGRKEYGTYDWTDGSGTLHKALGTSDPTVTKPEINVLYNAAQFYVDATTNELNLSLDGASGVVAGANIVIYPGPGPTDTPTIAMTSTGVLSNGGYRWAYSWRSTLVDGSHTTTALSPTVYGKATGGYNSASVGGDARPDKTKYDALYIWRTKVDDFTTFYLVDTITPGGAINIDLAWAYADNTADGSLGAAFDASEPRISVTPNVLLPGDPSNASGTPMGTLTLGPWGARVPVPGFNYDGVQAGAHLLFALDENHKEDSIAWFFRKADGTFPASGSAGMLSADYDNLVPNFSGVDWPASLNLWLHGFGQFDGGVQTAVGDHDPTDADVVGALDGYTYIRQDVGNEALWFRANDAWWNLGRSGFVWDASILHGDGLHPYSPNIKQIAGYDDPDIGQVVWPVGISTTPPSGVDAGAYHPDSWFSGNTNMDSGDGYVPLFGIIPTAEQTNGIDAGTFGTYLGPIALAVLDGNLHMSGSIVTGLYAPGTFGANRANSTSNYNPIYYFGGGVTMGLPASGPYAISGYRAGHYIYGDVTFADGGVTFNGDLDVSTLGTINLNAPSMTFAGAVEITGTAGLTVPGGIGAPFICVAAGSFGDDPSPVAGTLLAIGSVLHFYDGSAWQTVPTGAVDGGTW